MLASQAGETETQVLSATLIHSGTRSCTREDNKKPATSAGFGFVLRISLFDLLLQAA